MTHTLTAVRKTQKLIRRQLVLFMLAGLVAAFPRFFCLFACSAYDLLSLANIHVYSDFLIIFL